jgi:hypothetical protein
MGMDICGMAPSMPEGVYFGRDIWGWRPIADFIIEMQPYIAEKLIQWDQPGPDGTMIGRPGIGGWHYNDGGGLDAEWSMKLANELDKMVDNGGVEAFIKMREVRLKQLPNGTCVVCQGTGIQTEDMARQLPHNVQTGVEISLWDLLGPADQKLLAAALGIVEQERTMKEDSGSNRGEKRCHYCNGRGWGPSVETQYYLRVNDIRQFSAFLRASGGFQIW